jgi:hypothetical protein
VAITVVQTATGTGNPPFSFGSAVTVGNTVILFTPGYSTTGSTPSTGSVKLGGNTITGTEAFFNNGTTGGIASASAGGNVAYASLWMLPNVQVAGQTAVDITFTAGNSGIGGVAWEVSGLGPSPQLDQSSSGTSVSATTNSSGTTPAITGAPEFIAAGAMMFSGAGAGSPAGFTVSNPSGDCWAGYQIATSSGGTYTWSQTSAGTPWSAIIATVKAAPTPAPVYALQGARPKLIIPLLTGRIMRSVGAPVNNPGTVPVFGALPGPVRASLPLVVAGRAMRPTVTVPPTPPPPVTGNEMMGQFPL